MAGMCIMSAGEPVFECGPVLTPLNDSAYSGEVIVDPEAGTVAWPDGIDLAPEPLYEQARAHPLATIA